MASFNLTQPIRFIVFCFLFFTVLLVAHGQVQKEKNSDKTRVLPNSVVKAQLKIADSLSLNYPQKADSVLTYLLNNRISDKAIWQEVVEIKCSILNSLSKYKEDIEFINTIIESGNSFPRLYYILSREYTYVFDYSNAIRNAQEAVFLYKKSNNLFGIIETNYLLIKIYGELEMFDKAKLIFTQNIKLANSINYKEGLVSTYLVYGEALVFQDPTLAAEYMSKAMQLAEFEKTELHCRASIYLIRFYINTNQLDEAKKLGRKYLEHCFFTNYQRNSNVYTLMAHISSLENNIDSTIYFNTKALEIRLKGGNKKMIANSYLNLAGNYLAKNEIEKANDYLEKAENVVFENYDSEMLLIYYRNKIKYFDYTHDYKDAYLFSQKEIKLSQEITDQRHKDVLSKLNTSFAIQQKNLELERELESRRAATRLMFFILASLLFFLVGGYFIYLYRKKNYSYLRLVNRASSIEKKLTLSDKERFKFQSVFEYSVTGILILDKNGIVQYINRKGKNLLGEMDDALILRIPFVDFFEGKNKTIVQEALLNVFIEHEADKGIKVQIIHQHNFHWLDISLAPLEFEQENDTILITLIDVTQEVINIGLEQKQNQELQTLLNSVTESILFIQRNGKIKALNNTAASRFNSNPEALKGANYFDYVPKTLRNKRIEMFDKVIRTKRPLIELEMVENYNNLVSMYPNINLDGEVDYISEFVQDITERRKAEEQIDNLKQSILRSQMNPHFIFNSLTSIQGFVIRNEADMASRYLNSFARLIRLILESSRHDFISLKSEIEILNYYLDIQKMRFSDNFTYSFEIDPKLDIEKIKVPPMLAQPFIENSIEHGIQHLEKTGVLNLKFIKTGSRLLFEVSDNGIGRQASQELNRENMFASKSLSTRIVNDRLNALNKYNKDHITYNIIDLKDEHNQAAGTQVIISIPIITF